MASTLTITITSPVDQVQLNTDLRAQLDGKYEQIQDLESLMRAAASGDRAVTLALQFGATVRATGTLTLASVVATNSTTIAGQILTAVAAAPTVNQFLVGGSNAATALNLATAINANPTTSAAVTAVASGAVVTLTAVTPGTAGNAVTMVTSQGTITVSGATLTGGVAGVAKTLKFNMV